MEKIGLGIITYNRQNYFKQVLDKIDLDKCHHICVVNDGTPYSTSLPTKVYLIQHQNNKGVGPSKNDALKYLIEQDCEHLFIMEDDILIKNNDVFNAYIELSKNSGIKHFNFGYHGPANKVHDKSKKPLPRLIINYKDVNLKMALNKNCVGAFSYYHKSVIEKIGYMDEAFKNVWEHVEHTFRIIKEGYHPPFWWFTDLANSYKYLDEIACSEESSTIRENSSWQNNIINGAKYFEQKHGVIPVHINDTDCEKVVKQIKKINLLNKADELKKNKIALLCPTRNRLEKQKRLLESIQKTKGDVANFVLYFGVDDDDPAKEQIYEYEKQYSFLKIIPIHNDGKFLGLGRIWNIMASQIFDNVFAMIGDDMKFETKDWNILIGEEFLDSKLPKDKLKLVFCNDGMRGDGNIYAHAAPFPVNSFIHRKYYELTKHYVIDEWKHGYHDNWLNDVFSSIGRKTYKHDIIIRHLHWSILKDQEKIDSVSQNLEKHYKVTHTNRLYNTPKIVEKRKNEIQLLNNYIEKVKNETA